MADTIFFDLKLKRGRSPLEVFEKMAKSIKKRGATKNWKYVIDEEQNAFCVDFGDEKSETFSLHFEKQVAHIFCKVYFPLEGELFEDEKKSEFKALLNMVYSARTSFSSMEITDDYGLAEDFMESKAYKLKLRELTDEEHARAKKVYNLGYTTHTDFVLKLFYDYLEIPYNEEYDAYINPKVYCTTYDIEKKNFLPPFIETLIYETAEYKNEGRIYQVPEYFCELNGVWFSTYAFVLIMEEFILYKDYPHSENNYCFGVKHGQIRKYYKNKFLPMLENETDAYNKCILAYRFFVSVYDFCGFKYAGKSNDI